MEDELMELMDKLGSFDMWLEAEVLRLHHRNNFAGKQGCEYYKAHELAQLASRIQEKFYNIVGGRDGLETD